MRRRKVLATLAGAGIATIAGCSGGDNGSNDGNNGSSGGSTTTPTESGTGGTGSCVPAADDLASLLPAGGDLFEKGREASTGLSIGTDTYVVGRYETADGAMVDMLVAEYSSTDEASSSVSSVRSASENAVMGTLVDGRYIVAVDAPSPEIGRALVQESEVSCASQLSFGSAGGGSTDESFQLGEVVWSQVGGNPAQSNAVDGEGLSSSDPSQYTVELITASTQRPLLPAVTENALIGRSQIYNVEDGSVVAELPASSVQPPLVHEGIITLVADSEIRGVDAQSRQQSWSYLPSATVSGLVAGGGHLFAIVDDTTLIALDIQNGDKLWEREAERIFGYTAGRLFATSGSSNFAVNPSDGSIAYNIGRNIKGVSQDGSVYVGNIAKLNAADGSEVWNSSGLDEVLAVDDEYLYGRPDSIGANFTAVSASDGEQAWSRELETRSIAVGSNRVYTSSLNRIFALSKDTGEEQARYAVGGPDGLRVGQGVLVTVENAEATVLVNQ